MSNDSPENIVVGHYGPSGIGKTCDLGYSFPNALFIAAPGALQSIENVCGYEPARLQLPTIMAASELIPEISRQYKQIVFDDFSFLCERTASVLEGKYKGFAFWGKLRDVVLEFRDKCRFAKVDLVAISCWEKGPKVNTENGARTRGGMDLPSKMPEQVPALCDMVLRGTHDPQRIPWPAVYRCYLGGDYVMKDRFDIATRCDPAPMNMAELLRAAKVEVPRHEMYPNQEAEVQAISEHLSGDFKTDVDTVNAVYKTLIEAGTSATEARWTLRDALDRATIRRAMVLAKSQFVHTPKMGL